MLVPLDKVLTNLDGKALQNDGKNLTLRDVCASALLQVSAQENIPGDEKVKRYTLALAVFSSKEDLDLAVEDVALIKKLVGEQFAPMVVGQVWGFLR